MNELTPEDLLYGYTNGIFPMADPDGTLYWYAPDPRAIIPITTYQPARSLRPVLNKRTFEIRINTRFEAVIRGCSGARKDEDGTWISEQIIESYSALHRLGFAHSVEAFYEDQLVGGLYGVHIGSAFFGESMFHTVSNASKVAFHYLMEILKANRFSLLDTQFINDNVARYGAIEIPKGEYIQKLATALGTRRAFAPTGTLSI